MGYTSAMIVEPVASVAEWLEADLSEGQRRAQHAARQRLYPEQGTTYLEVLQAIDDTGSVCGVLVYQLPPGDDPYLVFVERAESKRGHRVGDALFEMLRTVVRDRPIEALAVGEEGAPAMKRWGFVESGGFWKYHGQ